MSTENLVNLSQFIGGGANYFDRMSKLAGYHYTEGVKYLRDNGGDWMVQDILICLRMVKKCQETTSIKFNASAGTVTYYGTNYNTGESVKLYTQRYTMCDVKQDITFFIGETLDNDSSIVNLLMLSNEY